MTENSLDAFLQKQHGLFINGAWTNGTEFFETLNPATGGTLSVVTQADEAEVDQAVECARKAQPGWAQAAPARRAQLLWKLADLVAANTAELARLETLDNGKPLFESSRGDLPLVAAHFRYYAGWADKYGGQTVPALHRMGRCESTPWQRGPRAPRSRLSSTRPPSSAP